MVAWLFIALLGALAMGMWVLANLHTWRRHRADVGLAHVVTAPGAIASTETTQAATPLAA
jgi:hypothetical protein